MNRSEELDAEGRLVTITIEHAQERTDIESFVYKTHRSAARSSAWVPTFLDGNFTR